MERAYRADELVDALVIDSEGYIYGKVGKIAINENEILLFADEDKPDEKTIADVASLKRSFLGEVKKTFGSRIRRVSLEDILETDIRKELGLGLAEPLNDQHYLKYAERLGFPVPYVMATAERKEHKGTVDLNKVENIRITVIGKEKGTTAIKVILLSEPKEAEFRNIPIQDKVPYRSTEAIKDKLVIDSEGNALGYVDSVVLFKGIPGIRAYVQATGGQVNLSLLTRYLDQSGQSDVADQVRKHLMNPESHRYLLDIEELEGFMRQFRVTFRLPEKVMMTQDSREFVADIPWDAIHKIGDVVLLKSTLTDLRSQGYVQRL